MSASYQPGNVDTAHAKGFCQLVRDVAATHRYGRPSTGDSVQDVGGVIVGLEVADAAGIGPGDIQMKRSPTGGYEELVVVHLGTSSGLDEVPLQVDLDNGSAGFEADVLL